MAIKLGNLNISSIKKGTTSIIRVYRGSNLIYPVEPVPAIDMSLFDENGDERAGGRSTANTYYVKTAGYYMFPVVYGNAINSNETNSTAYTNNGGKYSHNFVNHLDNQITDPWIENNTGCVPAGAELSVADTNNIFSDIKLVTGSDTHKYIRFKVNSVPAINANGIISVLDGNGTVMWSWFICCRQEGIETAVFDNHIINEKVISTHNIGDLWDTASHTNSYHWFYQWGRHVPLICGAAWDSTENHVSYGVKQYTTTTSAASSIGYAIQHPEMWFVRNDTTNSNWYNEGEGWIGVNLWNASATSRNTTPRKTKPVKTVYDPSPVGYTVPCGDAFTQFTSTGDDTSTASEFNVVGSFSNGWNFKRYPSDSTGNKFTCGERNRGGVGVVQGLNTELWYWTSQMFNVGGAMSLYASSSRIHPYHNRGVAYGNPVRFQKEDPTWWAINYENWYSSLSTKPRYNYDNHRYEFTSSHKDIIINQLRIKDTGDPVVHGSLYCQICIKTISYAEPLIIIDTYAKTIKIYSTTYNWSDAAIQSKHEGGYYYFDLTNTSIWGAGTKRLYWYQGLYYESEDSVTSYALKNAVAFGMVYR